LNENIGDIQLYSTQPWISVVIDWYKEKESKFKIKTAPAIIKLCYSHTTNVNISVCLGNNGHLTTPNGMADIPHHNHLTVIKEE